MTAQVHEELIYDGKKTSMAFCPPLPFGHPRIKELSKEEINKKDLESVIFSTACWRQYIGKWEIRNGRFYLRSLKGRYQLKGRSPLFADWFSGILRIPEGKMLHYVHMGFASVFEKEIHIKIEQGIVKKIRVVDNRMKQHDPDQLGWENLPGMENQFPGDDDM